MMVMEKNSIDNDGRFQRTDHSDVVEHEVSTALLLRREFVTMVKCVTVMGVGHQLRLGVKTEGGDIISETKRSSNIFIVLLNLIVVVVPVVAVVADLLVLSSLPCWM